MCFKSGGEHGVLNRCSTRNCCQCRSELLTVNLTLRRCHCLSNPWQSWQTGWYSVARDKGHAIIPRLQGGIPCQFWQCTEAFRVTEWCVFVQNDRIYVFDNCQLIVHDNFDNDKRKKLTWDNNSRKKIVKLLLGFIWRPTETKINCWKAQYGIWL